MNKKGAELPMNLIIIAAILLIVLIVILAIFSSRTQIFTKGISDCESKGGKCMSNCTKGAIAYGTSCNESKVCCIEVG